MPSNQVSSINVGITAEIAELKKGLNKANEQIASFAKRTDRDLKRVTKATARSSKSVLQMRRTIDTTLRGVAGSFAIREAANFSKAIARASVNTELLNQRIKVFTGSSAGFAEAYEAAQLLGVSVNNVAMGMGRIVAVGAEMGITTREARKMTTTFQQLALLSGSSIKESQAAFIQFTQALSANRLSGEELRSVREQAPLVAQAIAKYMGISVGEIKKVAEEGKITAEVMRNAMAMAADDAAEKFNQLPKSLERQQAEFENAWGRVMVALDTIFKQSAIWKFFYSTGTFLSDNFASQFLAPFALTTSEINKQVDELTRNIQENQARIATGGTARQQAADRAKYLTVDRANEARQLEVTRDRARLFELVSERQRRMAQDAIDAEKKLSDVRQQSHEEWLKGLDDLRVAITSQKIELTPMENYYRGLDDLTSTELEKQKQKWYEFITGLDELLAQGRINVDQYNRRLEEGFSKAGGLEEIKITSEKIFPKAEQEQLNQFVVQAARNMQSAFADFLFDPFKEGLKGMLKSFIDTIRRMVAEIAAQQMLTALFSGLAGMGGSIGNIGKSLLSGLSGRASGGPVSAKTPYIVGERGPELFVPGTSGRIIPGGGGGMVIAPVYNVDARGATQDLAKQLPSILAAHARQTVEMARRAINDDVSRNAFGRA